MKLGLIDSFMRIQKEIQVEDFIHLPIFMTKNKRLNSFVIFN